MKLIKISLLIFCLFLFIGQINLAQNIVIPSPDKLNDILSDSLLTEKIKEKVAGGYHVMCNDTTVYFITASYIDSRCHKLSADQYIRYGRDTIPEQIIIRQEFEIKPWEVALTEYGVTEIAGAANNNRIQLYHRIWGMVSGGSDFRNDEVPWCSSAVGYCVWYANGGEYKSLNNLARSWLKYGESVKLSPRRGDIAVFWRDNPKSYKGHVGFYFGEYTINNKRYVDCLSGNQSNSFNFQLIPYEQLIDIRR